MITDILIYETGNGGDLLLRGNDLVGVTGYENAPYLSMFGGAKWWGNYMLPEGNRFLSKTEDILRTTPLTSKGRSIIEEAVNSDLEFLKNIPDTAYSTLVSITAPDKVSIEVNINGKNFAFVWNPDTMYLTYKI